MSGFVLGITAQLVATNSNCHLSRIVRNSTSSSIVVFELWNLIVMMNMGMLHPAMVIIVKLHNHTSHVWHRLVANLVMNSYN